MILLYLVLTLFLLVASFPLGFGVEGGFGTFFGVDVTMLDFVFTGLSLLRIGLSTPVNFLMPGDLVNITVLPYFKLLS